MNQNTIQELNQLKLKFDSIITQIEKEHKSDTSFISALYTANHKWLQFINAQIKMKFPKRPPGWYGSNHNMCIAIYKSELYEERIKDIQLWLEDLGEGDACAGSMR